MLSYDAFFNSLGSEMEAKNWKVIGIIQMKFQMTNYCCIFYQANPDKLTNHLYGFEDCIFSCS